ncbi:hypothetical protein ABIA33_004077 [Streptacidiphilus sp. MAP12-16]
MVATLPATEAVPPPAAQREDDPAADLFSGAANLWRAA